MCVRSCKAYGTCSFTHYTRVCFANASKHYNYWWRGTFINYLLYLEKVSFGLRCEPELKKDGISLPLKRLKEVQLQCLIEIIVGQKVVEVFHSVNHILHYNPSPLHRSFIIICNLIGIYVAAGCCKEADAEKCYRLHSKYNLETCWSWI